MRSQLPLCQKPRLRWCAATSGVVCCHIWGVLPVRSFMRRSLFLSVERPFTSQTVFFGDRVLRKTLTLPEASTVWTVGMSGCFLGRSCAKAALEIMLSLFAAGSHQPLQHQPPVSVPWLDILGPTYIVSEVFSPKGPWMQKLYSQPGNLFIIYYRWPVLFFFFKAAFLLPLHFPTPTPTYSWQPSQYLLTTGDLY